MDPIIILPLAQGLGMGLAYVAPIGVENMYLANSALRQSRRRAFAAMVVVLLFDLSLSASAFWGMGVVLERHSGLEAAVRLLGGLLVIVMGVVLACSSLRAPRNRGPHRHADRRSTAVECVASEDGADTDSISPATAPTSRRWSWRSGRPATATSSAWAKRHPRASWMASTVAAGFAVTWCNPQAIIDGTLCLEPSARRCRVSGPGFPSRHHAGVMSVVQRPDRVHDACRRPHQRHRHHHPQRGMRRGDDGLRPSSDHSVPRDDADLSPSLGPPPCRPPIGIRPPDAPARHRSAVGSYSSRIPESFSPGWPPRRI